MRLICLRALSARSVSDTNQWCGRTEACVTPFPSRTLETVIVQERTLKLWSPGWGKQSRLLAKHETYSSNRLQEVTVDTWPASEGRDHAIGIHVLDSAHPEGFLLENLAMEVLDGGSVLILEAAVEEARDDGAFPHPGGSQHHHAEEQSWVLVQSDEADNFNQRWLLL
ncbi:hypothetical protein EK904_008317 [Melospiza melodia maxima]|nr:hypothetical protein EK904_008317 [Melospiza melodia maxima]